MRFAKRKSLMVGRLSAVALTVAVFGCLPSVDVPEGLVINEFMADNTTDSILDEQGNADDWIELFNGGDGPVALGGWFLSDDSTELDEFPLPDTTIPPGGHLIVWADGEPQQGALHASFKLSAFDGDEIILTYERSRIVDRIQFFPRNNNPVARVPGESYGRIIDGGDRWDQQRTPTPGAPNSGGRGEQAVGAADTGWTIQTCIVPAYYGIILSL